MTPRQPFVDSVQRLFEAVDATDIAPETPQYFHADWSEDVPGEMESLQLMRLLPTGARRQAFGNTFSRAQFVMYERSDTETEETARYIWCYTGPQVSGTPIEPHPESLEQDYGYQALTAVDVTDNLAERTATIGDCITLLDTIRQRGISPSRTVIAHINSSVYQLVHSGLNRDSALITEPPFRNALFTILSYMTDINPAAAKNLQSQVVSRLLQASNYKIGDYRIPSENKVVQHASIETLDMALAEGVLPTEPRIMDRLFRHVPMFTLPQTTDRLYDELRGSRYRATSVNISGIKRGAFAHDYMMAMLDGRVRRSDIPATPVTQHVKQALFRTESVAFHEPPYPFERVLHMANFAIHSAADSSSGALAELADRSPYDTAQADVLVDQAFLTVMEALTSEDTTRRQQDRVINHKAAAIVRMSLGLEPFGGDSPDTTQQV